MQDALIYPINFPDPSDFETNLLWDLMATGFVGWSCSRPLGQFNLRINLHGQFFNGNLSGKRIRRERLILQSILRVEVCQTTGKGYGFVYS